MRGFQITINNENTLIVSSDNLLNIILSVGYNDYMYVGGIDYKLNKYRWYNEKIELNDHIHIKMIEVDSVDQISRPYIIPCDIEKIKQRYYELKKELTEKGII